MKKKNQNINLIIVALLSLAYTVITILLMIGPVHMNSTGNISQIDGHSMYAIVYWVFAMTLSWFLYGALRKKPGFLFFVLIAVGIVLMITEVMMFG